MKEVLLSRDDTDGNLTAALLLEPTKPYVLLYDTTRVISLLKSFINSTVDSIVFHTGTSSADDDAANNSDDNSSQVRTSLHSEKHSFYILKTFPAEHLPNGDHHQRPPYLLAGRWPASNSVHLTAATFSSISITFPIITTSYK